MHRIDGPAAAPGGFFTEGDPNVGTPATVVTGDWMNAVQEELSTVITTGAGLALSKPSNAQLLAAILVLVGRAIPPGAVMAFAMAAAPVGWLACDGSLRSRAAYPGLFSAVGVVYGAGDGTTTFSLPDLRGEFLRGLDGGRGIDAGRSIGTGQGDALQNITGSFGLDDRGASLATGAFAVGALNSAYGATGIGDGNAMTLDASRVARTAAETRPRNIAVLFCIRT